MAYRVELTARAGRDLRHLYLRIHADDSAQAIAWFNRLQAIVYSLEKIPHQGATTPESKKLHHLHYGNKPHIYRVIYRVDERTKKVMVLHIRHGARDLFGAEETE